MLISINEFDALVVGEYFLLKRFKHYHFVRHCSVATVILSLPGFLFSQPVDRRISTLDSLTSAPIFFHETEIVIHGEIEGEGVLTYLTNDERRLLVLDVPPPPADSRDYVEIIGTFYDIGRLERGDPRISDLPFERLANILLRKDWPGVGELLVLVASSSRITTQNSEATLRNVALTPSAYSNKTVTVSGRFRGRNLYGDLPSAPGASRWDFVLASAEAALWIVEKEPKGDGFELDIQARADTGRWLQVTGSVSAYKGMTLIRASTISLAETADVDLERPPPQTNSLGPPPEVIFSTPLQGDTGVPIDTTIRIQFSRDIDQRSFENRIVVTYENLSRTNDLKIETASLNFEIQYRAQNRSLEILFEDSLESFRRVNIGLQDGIVATDGATMESWTLSFLTGP